MYWERVSIAGHILCRIFVFPFCCLSDVVSSPNMSCWGIQTHVTAGDHLPSTLCNGLKNIPLTHYHAVLQYWKAQTSVQRQRAQQPTLNTLRYWLLNTNSQVWMLVGVKPLAQRKSSVLSSLADVEKRGPKIVSLEPPFPDSSSCNGNKCSSLNCSWRRVLLAAFLSCFNVQDKNQHIGILSFADSDQKS